MKKLAYLILGFIIGAVLTYYFCPRERSGAPDVIVRAPKDTISVTEAIKLSNNWAANNETEIDSLLEVEGSRKKTRSVSWSLDEINEYLTYAQAESDTLGYTMTGVRVYLGNYGKNAKPPRKNRNTMFIVPTGHKNVSKASIAPNFTVFKDEDIPAPPLNDGVGGSNGYPQ
ncbi:hypothetical protein MBM09_08510 [Flaviramulus sp. BrNp1-15]|uniref:hypothetical protein n=1 Tax=Flaviramulus sp. BrNp1-15 TaxID=2916754 RepID=UPI001EE7E7E2|nr:hypothetical protein [Flaviramulus sp. BrNp1-15]ULC57960.1 hypothetical protein MBM09_08510 [Flaviramulus sp. BrNp1-15]